MKEKQLVKHLQEKDPEAVAALVNLYAAKILRGAYLILGDYQRAEDIVQETFCTALTKIDQFEGRSTLYSWLYRITINHCRACQRKKSTALLTYCPPEDLENSCSTPPDQIIDSVLIKQQNETVTGLVWTLPEKYRIVITLYYYEQFSLIEISAILDKNLGTVKSLLSRARKKLKAKLEQRGVYDDK